MTWSTLAFYYTRILQLSHWEFERAGESINIALRAGRRSCSPNGPNFWGHHPWGKEPGNFWFQIELGVQICNIHCQLVEGSNLYVACPDLVSLKEAWEKSPRVDQWMCQKWIWFRHVDCVEIEIDNVNRHCCKQLIQWNSSIPSIAETSCLPCIDLHRPSVLPCLIPLSLPPLMHTTGIKTDSGYLWIHCTTSGMPYYYCSPKDFSKSALCSFDPSSFLPCPVSTMNVLCTAISTEMCTVKVALIHHWPDAWSYFCHGVLIFNT